MAKKALTVLGIAAAMVALLLAVVALRQDSVGAQPIAGASYTGTVSPGGSVSLTVSADGTEVTQYSYTVTGPDCSASGAAAGASIPIENDAFIYETAYSTFSGSFPSAGTAEGTITLSMASAPCNSATWTATTAATPVSTPTPTPTPTPTATPTPTPTPTALQMHYCPDAGKWSIATWSGQDAMPIGDALAFCPGRVEAAYRIDPETQAWTRYFRDRPEISNLAALDDCQGVIALGGGVSAASAASHEALRAAANAMRGCPLQARWSIAVWEGDDGTDAEEALATCGEGAVAAAYSIDPQTQAWSRYFAGRAEISNLSAFGNMQGAIVLGGTEAPAAPTPMPTPSPAATPSPTPTTTPTPAASAGSPTGYLQSFHFALDISMEMDGLEMAYASEGDFEAPDSFSCDVSASMEGITFIDQRVVVIGDDAWIDTGDGWRETWSFDFEVLSMVGICPGSSPFWEGFSLEVAELALLPGEHETKNGEPAIHYSVAEFYEAFAGLGLIPEELEGVSIDAFDIWLAEDGYWLVSLGMEMSMEAELIEEFIGMPAGEIESISLAMSIDITAANDSRIRVRPPQVR